MKATKECNITKIRKDLKYRNMFWLFMVANVLGVILEGVWTVYKFGRWETHVVTIWGPFCLLYGVGAVTFYLGSALVYDKKLVIQFISFATLADLVEYICAWMIEDGLNLRAWTYKRHMLNLHGRICLQMTIIWGVFGVLYCYFLVPRLGGFFQRFEGKYWRIACVILSIFMIINMALTTLCLIRWSRRHEGAGSENQVEEFLDRKYNDEFMKKKFCEWWFIDEQQQFWIEYKKR